MVFRKKTSCPKFTWTLSGVHDLQMCREDSFGLGGRVEGAGLFVGGFHGQSSQCDASSVVSETRGRAIQLVLLVLGGGQRCFR